MAAAALAGAVTAPALADEEQQGGTPTVPTVTTGTTQPDDTPTSPPVIATDTTPDGTDSTSSDGSQPSSGAPASGPAPPAPSSGAPASGAIPTGSDSPSPPAGGGTIPGGTEPSATPSPLPLLTPAPALPLPVAAPAPPALAVPSAVPTIVFRSVQRAVRREAISRHRSPSSTTRSLTVSVRAVPASVPMHSLRMAVGARTPLARAAASHRVAVSVPGARCSFPPC